MPENDPLARRKTLLRVSLLLAVFGAAWGLAWHSVRGRASSADRYLVHADRIELTPAPGWIRSDVKGEVLRDTSLQGPLSLLDEDLAERFHQAFPLHPWIAETRRVTKTYPARVKVEVVYRRPVCMVEVPGGVYAADAEGVLLPSGDFSPRDAARYPLLAGVNSIPEGQVGARWGDERVHAGCRLAASLLEDWGAWKLARIVPDGGGRTPSFDLYTTEGARVRWGQVGQPEVTERKLQRLARLVAQYGALDRVASPEEFDLRSLDVGHKE